MTAPLWDLVQDGYDANWLCYITSNPAEHAAELDRQTLHRILALPGDLAEPVGTTPYPSAAVSPSVPLISTT